MLKLVVSSGPLLTSTAVLVLAHGMLMTTVSLVIKQQGYSTSSMAFVLAAYYLGLALGAWFQGGLVKKYGHIRVYAGMAALLVNVTLLMFVVRHPLGWFLLRVAVGFAIAGLFVVIESWLILTARIWAWRPVVVVGWGDRKSRHLVDHRHCKSTFSACRGARTIYARRAACHTRCQRTGPTTRFPDDVGF